MDFIANPKHPLFKYEVDLIQAVDVWRPIDRFCVAVLESIPQLEQFGRFKSEIVARLGARPKTSPYPGPFSSITALGAPWPYAQLITLVLLNREVVWLPLHFWCGIF